MSAEPAPKSYGAIPFPLQGGEMILQLVHRHWWYLWPRTILFLLVAIVPVIVVALILDAIGILDDLGIFFWIVAIVWLGYWGVRGALNWYRYANDIWVVTNQRIIDSFKPHPFSHHLATADLVNVQDISVDKIGFIATILKFGDVVCQTASAGPGAESFRIIGIPSPEQTQLLIDRERDRERNRLSGPGTATTTV